MDLARESAAIDSSLTTETVSTLSDDDDCSNEQRENDVAVLETTVSVNHESTASLSDVKMLVNTSGTYTDPSQTHVSINCESVPCQLACDSDSKKPDACRTETDNVGQLGEDTSKSEDTHVSLLPCSESNVENNLLCRDAEPVDLSKLGSALWPKSTLTSLPDTDNSSFAALVAEHDSFCKENAGAVADRAAFLSDHIGDTTVVHDDREALWPVVSDLLKESDKQSARQLPRCSELIRGISESHKKLCVSSNTSPSKLTTGGDKNAVNSSPDSVKIDSEPVSSLDNQVAGISNDVGENKLGVESERSDQPPSTLFLNREKILSLQFSSVPLSPKVISRIKELGLKRTDCGMLRPSVDKKQMTRKAPKPTYSASTGNPVDSGTAENSYNHQKTNHADKMDAILASADAAASCDQTSMQNFMPVPSCLKSDFTDGVGDNASTVLSGPSMQQVDLTPAVSDFHPVSDTSADTPVADVTSGTKKPIESFHLAAQSPVKTSVGAAASSSAIITSISVGTTNAEISAVTDPSYVQSVKKSELSARTVSLAFSERLRAKKYDGASVNGISEAPVDSSYQENSDSPQPQRYIHRSKHNVPGRNPRRETDDRFSTKERCHKSRKDSEGSLYKEVHSESRHQSQCSKCRHRRNTTNNAAYDQTHSHARCHLSHSSKHDRFPNMFDYYSYYRPDFIPTVNPSFLAAVSYSSYCLGSYNAHVQSMQYYNMLSQQPTATLWQQQNDYIRKMAKFYARS